MNWIVLILLLYLVYRVVGKSVLPLLQRRRLDRYKKRFFAENPHIDADRYHEMKRTQEENAPIIDKRLNFKRN